MCTYYIMRFFILLSSVLWESTVRTTLVVLTCIMKTSLTIFHIYVHIEFVPLMLPKCSLEMKLHILTISNHQICNLATRTPPRTSRLYLYVLSEDTQKNVIWNSYLLQTAWDHMHVETSRENLGIPLNYRSLDFLNIPPPL